MLGHWTANSSRYREGVVRKVLISGGGGGGAEGGVRMEAHPLTLCCTDLYQNWTALTCIEQTINACFISLKDKWANGIFRGDILQVFKKSVDA